jgi:glucose/arabinose dehydrogenase
MLSLPRILTSLLCISLVSAQSSGQCKINSLKTSYAAPVAADGWSYRLVATELSRPRGILFDTEGALIVVDTGVGLVHLELEDQGRTCLRVRKKTVLLENEDVNHLHPILTSNTFTDNIQAQSWHRHLQRWPHPLRLN